MAFAAHFAPQWNRHEAPETTAGATVAFNKNGSCTRHPDILLRQKKTLGLGWKILLHECPRCKVDWEDERIFKQQQQQQEQKKKPPQKPHKPAKNPVVVEATEGTSDHSDDDEEEVVYTPPKKTNKPTQKQVQAKPPSPPPRQRLQPPPVRPLVEAMAPIDMQMAALQGNIGQLVALMRQYMGSAKLAGIGCEYLWQLSNNPQNGPMLRHHAISVVDDAVFFYQNQDAKVGYYGPLLLESLTSD